MDDQGRRNSEAPSSIQEDADSFIPTDRVFNTSANVVSTCSNFYLDAYEKFEQQGEEDSCPQCSGEQNLDLYGQQLEGTQIITKGIASVVCPVMKDFDSRAEGALKSQGVLKNSIERLTRELDKLLEDAPLPFITQHATKLSGVRKRVSSLSSTLQTIQRRIDNIERMLFIQGLENGASSWKGDPKMLHNGNQHVEHRDVDVGQT